MTFACGRKNVKSSKHELKQSEATVWRVDSLDIPDCKLCDEVFVKVNKLYGKEVNIGHRLELTDKRLLHINTTGDTIYQANYTMDQDYLTTYGSDWNSNANIIERTEKTLILKKPQKVINEEGGNRPENDLIIYLTRIK